MYIQRFFNLLLLLKHHKHYYVGITNSKDNIIYTVITICLHVLFITTVYMG